MDPTLPVMLTKVEVPSVAPKNSTIHGILNRFLNSIQMSGLRPFPMATLALCTPSNGLYRSMLKRSIEKY